MNTTISSSQSNTLGQQPFNLISNKINSINYKSNYEEEHNELKNMRIEFALSLRKKKLNEILFSKRKKLMESQGNINEEDSNELYACLSEIKKNVPILFAEEFDIYEDKISVIHQILNKDYTMLHGMEFNEKYILQFIIYKLTDMSYRDNDFYVDTSDKDLIMIFYDLIKLINENNEKKIIFSVTVILINFLYSSRIIVMELKKANIWKRLAEFSELKNPEINDNIVTILSNSYSTDKSLGKEYILSNYSRYIKQIITNSFKTFVEDSKNETIDLNLYSSCLSLIKKLIKQENSEVNKNNDFDVIVKMKFIYDYITKIFTIVSSWILNNVKLPKHEQIFKFLSNLLELLNTIGDYANEESYQLQEFAGESFATSFCCLLKFLILDKEKFVFKEYILSVIADMYSFISKFFCVRQESEEIYSKNNIIIITEEFIRNINLINSYLVNKIIFFLSNYVDNESRAKEVFEECDISNIIMQYSNDKLYDNKICYNIFWFIRNGFTMGNNITKGNIIANFRNFLAARIKILYDSAIRKESDEAQKIIKFILEKINLFYEFFRFLRYQSKNNLLLLKNLVDYIKITNIEEYIMNLKILINKKENEDNIDDIEKFLKEIKK